jgi:hypothetical protein
VRGFILGFVGLTLLEVALAGQTSGQGGNIGSLLAWPPAVAKRFLDPGRPFFTVSAAAAAKAAPSASITPALSGPLTAIQGI